MMNSTRFSPLSTSSSSSSSGSGRDDTPPVVPKTSKICGVCGDVARCYHFGGLCCASCKAFFRRAVVNDRYKQYRCVYGGSCRIDIISRKHCSHCRLKRCLAIGMDKKWFMSDEMRAELKLKSMKKLRNNQQQLMALTQQICHQLQRPGDGDVTTANILTSQQMGEIRMLIEMCRRAYHDAVMPDEVTVRCSPQCASSPATTAIMFATAIRRTFVFLQSIPQLQQLNLSRRMGLLKHRGMESLIVLSTLTFDPIARGWNSHDRGLIREPKPIHVCEHDFERLHGETVTRKHFDTISSLLSLHADEPIITLLSLIAFFTLDDQEQIVSCEAAQIIAMQEHFIELLKHYVHWKMGGPDSEKVFARYILKLSDVREVNNLHRVTRLRLSEEEIQQLDHQLGGLHLTKEKV